MSDPRQMMQGRPPMPGMGGGMPPGGPQGGPPGGDPMSANKSPFNPTDLAAMVQSGELTPQTTVREMFQKMGIDVEGPITQLSSGPGAKAIQNADPLGKMKNMGQNPGQGQPPAPQGDPGISGLMQKLGG